MSRLVVFESKQALEEYENKRRKFYSERVNLVCNCGFFGFIKFQLKEKFDRKYKAKKREYDTYSKGIWKTKNPNHYMGNINVKLLENIYHYDFKPGDKYTQVDDKGKIISNKIF